MLLKKMAHFDFPEFFPPRLVQQVRRVLLDRLEGPGRGQGRKVRKPPATLKRYIEMFF
jgi:hypothetical protein